MICSLLSITYDGRLQGSS
ncbi:uncharacterized protein FTOL_06724 [Fusarium torulosum]|uniref:Uncharacterized protein n=1 Tax=Fusarium torulosum TaxID=33205 RepID=A0AAE8MAL1_9HYPO|nr:uncharacterized protein FTOL_06724 [Fusarium torulosum]